MNPGTGNHQAQKHRASIFQPPGWADWRGDELPGEVDEGKDIDKQKDPVKRWVGKGYGIDKFMGYPQPRRTAIVDVMHGRHSTANS